MEGSGFRVVRLGIGACGEGSELGVQRDIPRV